MPLGRPANDLAQTDKEKPRLQAGALALCAILKAMRADDRETGPRTDQQVDAVAGVMAQGDGDLPSAGTHSASYWRRGSEPACSGVGAIRGFGPSRPEKASCYKRAPPPLHMAQARGGLAATGGVFAD